MRIGFVVPGGVDRSGSHRVIPVLLNLIERLARRHSVCVFALHQSPNYERYELQGATIVSMGRTSHLPRGMRTFDRLCRLVINILREKPRFDILHACFASEPGALAVAAGRLLNIPVVTSVLGGEFVSLPNISYGEQRSRASRVMVSFAARHSTAITAPSTASVAQCPRPDTHYITMGVNCEVFQVPPCLVPGPPWRLLHVGNLNRVKDQETLLRAFRHVLDHGLDAYLDIVGEDTLNGAIQQVAAELEVESRVKFHGFMPNHKVANLYRRSHLYVHSSLHEGMPVSALEAAACGVPLVGTAVGLFQELASNAAISVRAGSAEALADAVVAALSDQRLRNTISAAALQFARRYDANWTACAFLELYERLVPAQSSRSAANESAS